MAGLIVKDITHVEQTIIKAAEAIVDYVNSGDDPNDAVVRAANEHSLTREMIKRCVEAFNTSRVLSHFSSASPDRRADVLPLADSDVVIGRVFPDLRKAASTNVRSMGFVSPPDFNARRVKEAQPIEVRFPPPYPGDLDAAFHRARVHLHSLRTTANMLEVDRIAACDRLADSLAKAANYFRQVPHIAFSEVETNLLGTYGPTIRPIVDVVYKAAPSEIEKRGSADRRARVFDVDTEPYRHFVAAMRLVDGAVASAKSAREAARCAEKFASDLRALEARRMAKPSKSGRGYFDHISKQASGLVPTLTGLSIIGSKINELGDKKTVDEKIQGISDPEQDRLLQAVKVQAMVNDFLSYDPVISRHPEDAVIDAYNEISSVAPRLATKPIVMRSLLARRLELGRMDPMEVEQVIAAERNMQNLEGMS